MAGLGGLERIGKEGVLGLRGTEGRWAMTFS